MNRQDKIDKIYKEIANKELSFGCKIEMEEEWEIWRWRYVNTELVWKDSEHYFVNQSNDDWSLFDWIDWDDYKKIWHPVMIWDVLDYWDNNILQNPKNSLWLYILKLWKLKRLPIEEQSDECIDYIFNLLQWKQ